MGRRVRFGRNSIYFWLHLSTYIKQFLPNLTLTGFWGGSAGPCWGLVRFFSFTVSRFFSLTADSGYREAFCRGCQPCVCVHVCWSWVTYSSLIEFEINGLWFKVRSARVAVETSTSTGHSGFGADRAKSCAQQGDCPEVEN